MSASETTSTHKFNAKKELILSAATQVFNRKGIRGGTLEDVATSVGLATNSVSYYYRKRDDLAAACLLRTIETFSSLVTTASTGATVAQRIERLYAQYLEVLASVRRGEHPELMSFANLRAVASPQVDGVLAAHKTMATNARNLLKGPETQGLSRADFSARTYMMISHLSWVRLWLPEHELDEFPTLARRISDIMLRGIAPSASAPAVPAGETAFWAERCGMPDIADPFLRAGSLQINQHGYRGASINRISAELDLTKGAFYGRRSGKDELVEACFERKFRVSQLVWDSVSNLSGTGWERLCIALKRLVWFQLSEFGPLVRTAAIMAIPDPEFQTSVRARTRHVERVIAHLVVDGMMDGSIRPCDPLLASRTLSSVIDHAASLPGWEPSANADNVAALFLRPALYGLVSASGSV
jgi:AcrR family transcriptional regulator